MQQIISLLLENKPGALMRVTGLISQRLSNEPEVPLSSGRTLSLVAPLVSSFAAHYEPRPSS